jgi:hypothetical protein
VTANPSPATAAYVTSVADYERRLRKSMRLMARPMRDGVAKEIVGGIELQVQAGGGNFAAVAPSLDDPAWVGRQMVGVYGPSPAFQVLVMVLGLLLGIASVPGLLARPADSGGALLLAFLGFALLIVVLFWGAVRVSARAALLGAALAAAARVAGLFVTIGEFPPIETLLPGELGLYLFATVLLIVVAGLPAAVSRARGSAESA